MPIRSQASLACRCRITPLLLRPTTTLFRLPSAAAATRRPPLSSASASASAPLYPSIPTRMSSTTITGTAGSASAAGARSYPTPTASTSALPGNTPSSAAVPKQQQQQPSVTVTTAVEDDTTTTTTTTTEPDQEQQQQESKKPILPLPAPDPSSSSSNDEEGTRIVQVNGKAVALDKLGPMVVGRDGTVSRIANWPEMTEIERQNTLRILCKRNQLRLANLRAGREADAPIPVEGVGETAAAAAAGDSPNGDAVKQG
ncbi:hypothetical protein N656DRAFT_783850 [Canariomyces notabilis]|uniref:Uncharacterized protein n=1 Tax=Canariomyces notabilis TaxID=2074819 RepID=A0AAN6T8F9_9PEZI|nr:hypothetical protein N656DRAFT_783850 [Canariomyces arenarius]